MPGGQCRVHRTHRHRRPRVLTLPSRHCAEPERPADLPALSQRPVSGPFFLYKQPEPFYFFCIQLTINFRGQFSDTVGPGWPTGMQGLSSQCGPAPTGPHLVHHCPARLLSLCRRLQRRAVFLGLLLSGWRGSSTALRWPDAVSGPVQCYQLQVCFTLPRWLLSSCSTVACAESAMRHLPRPNLQQSARQHIVGLPALHRMRSWQQPDLQWLGHLGRFLRALLFWHLSGSAICAHMCGSFGCVGDVVH